MSDVKDYTYIDRNGDHLIASAYVPTDPAELHKLTEAIHGRKIAAIVYEDELPEIPIGADLGVNPHWGPEHFLSVAQKNIALARATEARDAAAKERERAEEAEVQALDGPLADAFPYEDAARPVWWTELLRRAYELGARAPQATTDGGES